MDLLFETTMLIFTAKQISVHPNMAETQTVSTLSNVLYFFVAVFCFWGFFWRGLNLYVYCNDALPV